MYVYVIAIKMMGYCDILSGLDHNICVNNHFPWFFKTVYCRILQWIESDLFQNCVNKEQGNVEIFQVVCGLIQWPDLMHTFKGLTFEK